MRLSVREVCCRLGSEIQSEHVEFSELLQQLLPHRLPMFKANY